MRDNKLYILIIFLTICIATNAKKEPKDSVLNLSVGNDGANRNMLMNAASASQPRQISMGVPTPSYTCIYEDGLPVSYYMYQLFPYKSWQKSLSHSQEGTMTPADMALRYGKVEYGVTSQSRLAGDKSECYVDYLLNQYGRQMIDAYFTTPIGKGWGIGAGSYQDFDPGSNHLKATEYPNRVQFYKTSVSKTWNGGRGHAGLIYQYSINRNIIENFGPFIFVGDGSVKEYNGFNLGIDSYLPSDNTIYYKDIMTGKMTERDINDANTDRIHNIAFLLRYDYDNGTHLEVNGKYKSGTSKRANSTPVGTTIAKSDDSLISENGSVFENMIQLRRTLIYDATERSWMSNASLNGISKNKRHHWRTQIDYWYDYCRTNTALTIWMHEVKKDPATLLIDNQHCIMYNTYGEYYDGHEQQIALSAQDEWQVNKRLWLKAGFRLSYNPVSGKAANDDNPANQRYNGFSFADEGVTFNHFATHKTHHSFVAEGQYKLSGKFGLVGGAIFSTVYSQLYNYGAYSYPLQDGIAMNYVHGGVFFKNKWIDLTSQIAYISETNTEARMSLNHVMTKDVDGIKAGQTINYLLPKSIYYDMNAWSWITDAMITPMKGLQIHVNITIRKPQYDKYNVSATFIDGVSESYDFSGKTVIGLSKFELELEPSYSFDRWRVWLSARCFSKQYINLTNSLYFNGRTETFGGIDFRYNKNLSFTASVINILNQKGASGTIPSANTVTDPTPYKNYLMAGTFIRPFTFELTTHIKF